MIQAKMRSPRRTVSRRSAVPVGDAAEAGGSERVGLKRNRPVRMF